jgi:hypothetical protein
LDHNDEVVLIGNMRNEINEFTPKIETTISKIDLFYRKDSTPGCHKIINKQLLIKSGKRPPA